MSDQNLSFTKKVYGDKQFQYSIRKETLPDGFIQYHSNNFCEYFNMSKEEFVGKKLLGTGCGPGKHAVVLALMGAQVTAMDLSDKNLEKGAAIKTAYSLDNLNFVEHNLMNAVEGFGTFELISAHNWMQHAEVPGQVLKNLADVLEVGGKIYLSLYLAGTFRFYIAQIARAILRPDDYELAEQLVRYHFPQGFKVFDNYLDIYLENIFDDFFVPYCHSTNYDIVLRDAQRLGLQPYTQIPDDKDLADIDNRFLRVGLEKKEHIDFDGPFEFSRPVDEFESERPEVAGTASLARAAIEAYAHEEDRAKAVSFCLGLYRLRADVNKSTSAAERHEALRKYLDTALGSDLWNISFYNTDG